MAWRGQDQTAIREWLQELTSSPRAASAPGFCPRYTLVAPIELLVPMSLTELHCVCLTCAWDCLSPGEGQALYPALGTIVAGHRGQKAARSFQVGISSGIVEFPAGRDSSSVVEGRPGARREMLLDCGDFLLHMAPWGHRAYFLESLRRHKGRWVGAGVELTPHSGCCSWLFCAPR